jgi:uncharacterized membrane protein YczE
MNNLVKKTIRLFAGLFLMGLSIALMIKSNLGLSPFDVFHDGLSKMLGITFGKACVLVSFVIICVGYLSGERYGWGSLANMCLVGVFIDFILTLEILPTSKSIFQGLLMLSFGMLIFGFSSFLYLSAGLGSGPRDSIMILLIKKTGKSVSFIRGSMESLVLLLGYIMGGKVGIGTLYISLSIGLYVQFVYRICNFDVKKNSHKLI